MLLQALNIKSVLSFFFSFSFCHHVSFFHLPTHEGTLSNQATEVGEDGEHFLSSRAPYEHRSSQLVSYLHFIKVPEGKYLHCQNSNVSG